MDQQFRDPKQITQMMPAQGWYVKTRHRDLKYPDSPPTELRETPLVCWTACIDDEGPFITGMIQAPGRGDLLPCSMMAEVDGYSHKP